MSTETHTYALSTLTSRSGIDTDVFHRVIKELPGTSATGPWLAGGALRRLLLEMPLDSDWDFFFRSQEQADAFEKDLKEKVFTRGRGTKHASTWLKTIDGKQIKVQAVKIGFYENPAALLDSFDFTICQLAWDGETLHVAPFTLWDLARKRLTVHQITYAAASVRRFLKYQTQGFRVCEGAIKTLLEAVSNDPSIINSEVEYVD